MKNVIEHDGVIELIEGDHIAVSILQQAACSGCKAKSMCTQSESKEKTIDVYSAEAAQSHKVGDKVTVCGTLSMGKQAVRLAFGVPLLLIVTVMPLCIVLFHLGELVSTLVVALVLVAYFYVLYRNQNRLAKNFAFWIK